MELFIINYSNNH